MAEKEQIINAFNKHFLEFITDVHQVFPTNLDIATAKKAIGRIIVLMPKLLIKMFNEHVVRPYKTQIEEGDLTFFIENNYEKDLNNLQLGVDDNSSTILQKIDCLRGPVREMGASEQQKVVKYLQNLAKLSSMM